MGRAGGSSSAFMGSGNMLGGDEVPSQLIPDPRIQPRSQSQDDDDDEEPAIRDITFWRTGFTIQNGPLMRYDDPQNSEILDGIDSGYVSRFGDRSKSLIMS